MRGRFRAATRRAAVQGAAFAAGVGGLGFELLAFRRFGLAVGNTADSTALVLGGYLFGMSLGGLLAARWLVRIRSPLRWAAVSYFAVGLVGAGADLLAASLGPVAGPLAVAVWLAVAWLPPVLMGLAFPLLFAAPRTGSAAGLIAANLLGSVAAAWGGGNVWIPEFGLAATRWSAAGAYGLAALGLGVLQAGAVRVRAATAELDKSPEPAPPPEQERSGLEPARREPARRETAQREPARRPAVLSDPAHPTQARAASVVPTTATGANARLVAATPGAAIRLAAAAGFVTLGLEACWLRRLPFFLEGFQPTVAGVLASVLVALTLGARFGPSMILRVIPGLRPQAADAGADRVAIEAAAWCLVFAAVLACAGGVEWLAPRIARWPIESLAGMHLRVVLATCAAAAPAAFALGAVVPLLLRDLGPGPTRGRRAGTLFFAHGLGGLAGALAIGFVLPALAPEAFHAVAVATVGAVGILLGAVFDRLAGRIATVAGLGGVGLAVALGLAGAGTPWAPEPPIARSRYDRPGDYEHLHWRTDAVGTASVSYDRRRNSMVLFTNEFRAAETGPGTDYMRALGQLPFLLRDDLRRVAVIALGTGTTARAVAEWPGPTELHVVELSPAVLDQVAWFTGDGPLRAGDVSPAWRLDPRTRVHVEDGRRFLATRPAGSLDLVTMEPLLPYAPGTVPLYTREFYQLAARALTERGLCVQWVPTHSMPAAYFETLLRTFAESFAHSSAWLVDTATLLVGSKVTHAWTPADVGRRLRAAPEPVRVALHRSGLARAVDLDVAFVGDALRGACADAELLVDDRPFLERIDYWSGVEKLSFFAANLAVLERIAAAAAEGDSPARRRGRQRRLAALADLSLAVLEPPARNDSAARAVAALSALRSGWVDSVLLHREETRALRESIEREVRRSAPRSGWRLAARHIERDPGSALLQAYAVAALPAADQRRAEGLRTARFLDPGVERSVADRALAAALRGLPADPSPVAETFLLPAGDDLYDRVVGGGGAARALRATFPTRSGRALVSRLAREPLPAAAARALRELADPLLLDLAWAAIARRNPGGRLAEFAPLWRRDLPLPKGVLTVLAAASTAERVELAGVIQRRRGPRARRLLADLLEDPDLGVRRAAGAALATNFPGRFAYDPTWPISRRREVADVLRR